MIKKTLLATCLLTGCATLTNGPVKRVAINSDPSGAVVVFNDGSTMQTPCIANFSGFKNQKIKIEKQGYESREILLTKRFLSRFFWNVLFWPGAVVDLATGSVWRLEPRAVEVVLKEKREIK